jgi:peptide/nickel transport system permease protein
MVVKVLVRLAHAALSVILLTIFVFAMVRLTGDPASMLLPETASQADVERLRARLGLDQPIPVQYAIYLGDLIRGDLGEAIRLKAPVSELILSRLPATLQLTVAGLILTLVIGIPLGVYSAYRRGSVLDRTARLVSAFGMSAPSFWVALILILVFAVNLRILPAGGFRTPETLILPAVAVSIVPIAGLTRLLRSSMIDVLGSDYVKFLRIKGLSESEILWKHALRNAGLTTLTFVGVLTAGLLTGSLVTEKVFNWPGVGLLAADSIEGRDFTTVQGVVLFFSIVYIVVNLLVDILYTVLNPRLRWA